MFYYPPPPRNTTHYLRPTKLDHIRATYIRGYYRVLTNNKKKKNMITNNVYCRGSNLFVYTHLLSLASMTCVELFQVFILEKHMTTTMGEVIMLIQIVVVVVVVEFVVAEHGQTQYVYYRGSNLFVYTLLLSVASVIYVELLQVSILAKLFQQPLMKLLCKFR